MKQLQNYPIHTPLYCHQQSACRFACSLCQPPSRAVKRRKLSQNPADIIPQLLDEQRVQAV